MSEAPIALDTLLNSRDGVRYQVNQLYTRLIEKVFSFGLNCSDYRGINQQLISRILGLYPTGVKRKPTVKCNHVPLCERRKRNNRSEAQTGLAATDVIIAWQSHHSSPNQRNSGTWRRMAVIVKD